MAQYGSFMQRTTTVVLNLIIINTLVFVAQTVIAGDNSINSVTDLFALHHYRSAYFKPHQLITHMFMHAGLFHLLFNMYSLWMFGSVLERLWGPKKFLVFYFICGLASALAQMGNYIYSFGSFDHMSLTPEVYEQYQSLLRRAYTVGASGAIMGLLGGFAYLFPNTTFYILPIPVPVKAKYLVAIFAAFDLFGGFTGSKDSVAHFAHLGGLAMGLILVIVWNRTNKKTFY